VTRIEPCALPAAEAAELLAKLPDLGLFRVLAHAPTAFGPWVDLGSALLTSLALDPVVRELAILQVAVTLGCDYERNQHESVALGVGVSQSEIDRVVAGESDDPVLLAVQELVDTRTLSADSYAATVERLGERQTIELVLVVGYYVAAALLMSAVDLDLDEPAGMTVVAASRELHPR
jgi:AhpD family alkylhydroperoxidase